MLSLAFFPGNTCRKNTHPLFFPLKQKSIFLKRRSWMVEEGQNKLQEECHFTEEINPGKMIVSLFSTPFPQVSALPPRSVEKVVEKGMVSVPPLSYTHNSSDSPESTPSNRRASHFFEEDSLWL
jgi:hypothetical protein